MPDIDSVRVCLCFGLPFYVFLVQARKTRRCSLLAQDIDRKGPSCVAELLFSLPTGLVQNCRHPDTLRLDAVGHFDSTFVR